MEQSSNWTPLEIAGALVYVAIACAVTVHALLRKRDVAAAIAWIGLAWLSPIIGGVLYTAFGINRVERRALRTRGRQLADWNEEQKSHPHPNLARPRADHLAPFEHAVGVLTRRPPLDGNDVRMLRSGDEAYPPMLAAIDEAERSVALSSYIFRDDAAGGRFIAALVAAHQRGVAVRVLVDGIGSGYFRSPAYERLRAAGVPAERFIHTYVPWRMPFLNLRNHKKILVADGRRAFTGGINIADENLAEGSPAWPVRDMHFEVRGPVVAQIVEAFAADWLFASGEELEGPVWFPELAPAGTASARVITSGPDHELERIGLVLLAAVSVAQRRIQIITPYFLPDDRFISALTLAAMRGVAVDIVVPEQGDHALLDWAMSAHVAPLIAAGGRVWRAPLPFDHSKLMTIDEEWSLIGSANWDMRSLRLNFEMNVAICCPEFGRLVATAIAHRQDSLITLEELRARPLPARLRDAAARLMLPYL